MSARRIIYPVAVGAMAAAVWWISPKEQEMAPPPAPTQQTATQQTPESRPTQPLQDQAPDAKGPDTMTPDTSTPQGAAITAIAVHGQQMLTGDATGHLSVWDLAATPPTRRSWAGHAGAVRQVAADGDGWMSVSGDGTVAWWGADTRIVERKRQTGRMLNDGVQVGPLGALVVDDKGTVARLDTEDAQWRARTFHLQGALAIARSPDGSRAISGGVDGSIGLWSITGDRQGAWIGHTGWVTDVAWAPGHLVTASADKTVSLWAAPEGAIDPDQPPKPRATLTGHTDTVLSVDVAGDMLASGGLDGTLRLWSLTTGALARQTNTGGPIYHVAFNGPQVITGGDGSVKLWQIDTLELIRTLGETP
ncbi:MAG: WD40 repeat domain-containing protein [Bradymonadia bacterium]